MLLAILLTVVLVSLPYYARILHYRSIPTVWPVIPWFGDTWSYLWDSIAFLSRCQESHGSVFRIMTGTQSVVVVCDAVALNAVFKDKNQVLSTNAIHQSIAKAMGDVESDVGQALAERLLPITLDIFSRHTLPRRLVPCMNNILSNFFDPATNPILRQEKVSIYDLVCRSMYTALSRSVFGDSFPVATYDDFMTLDANMAPLVLGLPFIGSSAKKARRRLLDQVGQYINGASGDKLEHYTDTALDILQVVQDLHLPPRDQNGMLLLFMWGLHTSIIRTAFWLLMFLLNDPAELSLVRDEVDSLVSSLPDGASICDITSQQTEGTGFTTMQAAIKEALRVSALSLTLREACQDVEIITGKGECFIVQKGELIALNVRAIHHSPAAHAHPLEFHIDRSLSIGSDSDNITVKATGGTQSWPFGAGAHICKGRFLTMHLLKMFLVFVLSRFDLKVVTQTGQDLGHFFLTRDLSHMELWKMRAGQPIFVQLHQRIKAGSR